MSQTRNPVEFDFRFGHQENVSVFNYSTYSYYSAEENVLNYMYSSSTPTLYASSQSLFSGETKISFCIPMTDRASDAEYDSLNFWMQIWQRRGSVPDGDRIATVSLTSMASSCKQSCQTFDSARDMQGSFYTACDCPVGSENVDSFMNLEVHSVMWVLLDRTAVAKVIALSLATLLCVMMPVMEALMHRKEDGLSTWNVIRNILFLLCGGLATAIVFPVMALIADALFDGSVYGVGMYKGIRYHIAPFGKTLKASSARQGRLPIMDACNMHGESMVNLWPVTLVWIILLGTNVILQIGLTLATFSTIIGIPFSIIHWNQLVYLFTVPDVHSCSHGNPNFVEEQELSDYEDQKTDQVADHFRSKSQVYQLLTQLGEFSAERESCVIDGKEASSMLPGHANELQVPTYEETFNPVTCSGLEEDCITPPPYYV